MTKQPNRMVTYDILRGYFLFVMILLHIMINYYPTDFPYALVGFTTGSFALLSGMIAGERAQTKPPRLTKALFQAAKLGLYFIAANTALATFSGKSWQEIAHIFINGAPQQTTFEILLPIAYAQIISLFIAKIPYKSAFIFLLAALIAIDVFPQFVLYNALFLTIELLGFLIGNNIRLEEVADKLQHYRYKYVLSIGATLTSLPFIIGAPSNWFFQLIFGFSSGGLLFLLLSDFSKLSLLTHLLTKLSEQSLFVYISHIGISAYLDRMFPYFTANLLICILITTLLSVLLLFPIWVIQILQQKGPPQIALLLKTVLQ